MLLSIDEDQLLCAWDVESGTRSFRVERACDEQFESLACSADDKMLAICSSGDVGQKTVHRLLFRSLADGKVTHPLDPEPSNVHAAAFSLDGRLAALHEGEDVTLWNLHVGRRLHRIKAPHCHQLVFDQDSKWLAGRAFARIRLWDVTTGREFSAPSGNDGLATKVFFTNRGSTLLTFDATLKLWDAETGAQRRVLAEEGGKTAEIVASFDRKTLVSVERPDHARVWDADSGQTVRRITIDLRRPSKLNPDDVPSLGALGIASRGAMLLTVGLGFLPKGGWYHEAKTWDSLTGRLIDTWSAEGSLQFLSPDGRLAVSDSGLVKEAATGHDICQLGSGKSQQPFFLDPESFVDVSAFSRDGRLLAATRIIQSNLSGTDHLYHFVQVWELATRRPVFAIDYPEEITSRTAFSNDGRMLILAGHDGVIVCDTLTGRPLFERRKRGKVLGRTGYVSAIGLSPDGKRVATAHDDTTVLIWDIADAKPNRLYKSLGPSELKSLWEDLASPNARRGQTAVGAFIDDPGKSVRWLAEHLHAAKPVPADRIRQLIGQLDSPRFAERENALQELRRFGQDAEPALRRALDAKPSTEIRGRIESLFASIHSGNPPETLRAIRALQALEAIGTREAIEVLKRLAQGDPDAQLTRDAQASLERVLATAR